MFAKSKSDPMSIRCNECFLFIEKYLWMPGEMGSAWYHLP